MPNLLLLKEKKDQLVLQVMKTSNRQSKAHFSLAIGFLEASLISHKIHVGDIQENSSVTLKGKMEREQYFLVSCNFMSNREQKQRQRGLRSVNSMNKLKNAVQTIIPQYLCHMCPWHGYSTEPVNLILHVRKRAAVKISGQKP